MQHSLRNSRHLVKIECGGFPSRPDCCSAECSGAESQFGERRSLAQEHNWSLNAPELFTQMVRASVSDQALLAELCHCKTTLK